jgi:hypothetical protein
MSNVGPNKLKTGLVFDRLRKDILGGGAKNFSFINGRRRNCVHQDRAYPNTETPFYGYSFF